MVSYPKAQQPHQSSVLKKMHLEGIRSLFWFGKGEVEKTVLARAGKCASTIFSPNVLKLGDNRGNHGSFLSAEAENLLKAQRTALFQDKAIHLHILTGSVKHGLNMHGGNVSLWLDRQGHAACWPSATEKQQNPSLDPAGLCSAAPCKQSDIDTDALLCISTRQDPTEPGGANTHTTFPREQPHASRCNSSRD